MNPDPVVRFQEVFNALDAQNLHLVEELYGATIHFEDPMHTVRGLADLKAYFARLYANVEICRFEFHAVTTNGDTAMLTWTMTLKHKTFRPAETARIPGASWIRTASGKVVFHRDYFDVGGLIYERVPVLGAVVRTIKARL